ncbi:hypothetical protein FRC01_003083 [Tulasnella sp. 417]|nr:hypothetical protein FRC01_003083 [Tulasnella sp. 417]
MADFEEYVSFRGFSNEEAENFIRAVNIQAFKAQKVNDMEWIAGFASTGFSGKALRWYRRLPTATRQNWELLQEEILNCEWKEEPESTSLVTPPAAPGSIPPPLAAPSSIPEAAAAPMPSANFPPTASKETFSPVSLAQQPWRAARIRVLAEDPAYNGYLSLEDGLGYSSANIASSPVVTWGSSFSTTLEIQGATGIGAPYNLLCVQHLNDTDMCAKFGAGQTGRVMITAASSDPRYTSRTLGEVLSTNTFGKSYVTMWHVLEDLSVLPVIEQSGREYQDPAFILHTR